ncbi:MAG: TetR/AcrR family transcriptional regulator [Oscillospiraceae bacterium]|nr:TetR/AcrR family transcriptional regulator [Oscillospiraceae bacterium]
MERKPYKNAVENEQNIIFALAEIMNTKPFHQITVAEVCKKAGVSKNTFYRHFENLSDIIYRSIGEINNRLVEKTYATESHSINDFITLVCNTWYENRLIYKGFTQDEVIYIIRGYIKKDIMEMYEKFGIRNSDDGLFFEFFSTVFCMFLKWWSSRDFSETPEEIAKNIKDYLCGNVLERIEKYL